MMPPIFASTRWELVDQGRGYCCEKFVKMLGHLGFIEAGVIINTNLYFEAYAAFGTRRNYRIYELPTGKKRSELLSTGIFKS